MTLTFAILLGIIFLMEIGAGIAAYHLKGQVHRKMSKLVDLFYKPAQKHPIQFIPEQKRPEEESIFVFNIFNGYATLGYYCFGLCANGIISLMHFSFKQTVIQYTVPLVDCPIGDYPFSRRSPLVDCCSGEPPGGDKHGEGDAAVQEIY